MSSRWKIGLWMFGFAILAVVAGLTILSVLISKRSRVWMQDWLSHEYNSEVELSSFGVTIHFPLVQAEAADVTLHFKGHRALPPLIEMKRVTMRASMWGLIHGASHISFVRLEGLQIVIPPREQHAGGGDDAKSAMRKFRALRFDEILSEKAKLKILTSKPGKSPLEFDLQQLRMNSSGTDGALAFHATLSNPTPPGEIVSSGIFGPWDAEEPSQTPVSGNYTFERADLSVFSGISGILSSTGSYQGELDRIRVEGRTDTPDFRVTLAGHPVDLATTFQATVDGTDGDTFLHSVQAHFGQTDLVAQGSIEGSAGRKGKTITLDVTVSHARMEDLLLLAMKESPPMNGSIRLKTKLILVPGPKQIPDRIHLDGCFDLDSLRFASPAVQQKVDNLSKRGEGKPHEVVNPTEAIKTDDVASAVKGDFRVENGILTLSGLEFAMPGTDVQLSGTYSLDHESLDLRGKLQLQAKLSQTTTGIKSFLLRFADRFFSKNGKGAVVPIRITGPAQHPHYGLDFGQTKMHLRVVCAGIS